MSYNIVFCWSDISGYMASCWRELSKLPDINLYVIAFQARTQTAFSDQLMRDIPSYLLSLEERNNSTLIYSLVHNQNPDIVVLCGWLHKPYRELTRASQLESTRFVMGMDTPWQGTNRQKMARWALKSYLARIDHIVVTGERSWQYAKHLGISGGKITRGLYGINDQQLFPLLQRRLSQAWPKNFLFVGRYADEKAIDVLVHSYQVYRSIVSDPWSLICCGQGNLEPLLDNIEGITNLGFVQPSKMDDVWLKSGALILPSRFDPWPLAIVEAAAAGLPIICSNACGSSVEIVRDWHNGFIVPSDDMGALAQALVNIHNHHHQLPEWGIRSQNFSSAYSTDMWVQRWHSLLTTCQAGISS